MVDEGIVTPDQLTHALSEQDRTGQPLGEILVELGFDRPVQSQTPSQSSTAVC